MTSSPAPAAPESDAKSWPDQLWGSISSIYQAIIEHPFLTGLATGELDEQVFAYYVAQDAHYLTDYARALAIVGAKASDLRDTAMFARHAAGAVEVELSLHGSLLAELGIDPDGLAAIAISPTTRAYTSYLLATAHSGTFAEGVATVLPCYWIYARVGEELRRRGSPDPRFQRWIDTYGADEFQQVVDEVLDAATRCGRELSPADRTRATAHFVTTARYEWMFWDAAWRREAWPV